MNKKLQVMKFGGTSVGDAVCIRRSATIVANAAKQFSLAVVVSAMSRVPHRLIHAPHPAQPRGRQAREPLAHRLPNHPFHTLAPLVTTEPAPPPAGPRPGPGRVPSARPALGPRDGPTRNHHRARGGGRPPRRSPAGQRSPHHSGNFLP